jgi:Ice-binding-like
MSALSRFKTGFTTLSLAVVLAACGGDSTSNSNPTNPTNPNGKGPAPVPLGSAGSLGSSGSYAVLAKTGISNVTGSMVTGDVGLSPAAASFITGFSLVADSTNVFSTSSSVAGKVYAANYAVPSPSNLTTAIGSMETAYTDAAGRSTPDYLELSTGNLGGLTLAPGLYKWTSAVTIPTDVTIAGGANDVWIFQTSGNLSISAAKHVVLSGGAQAKNIFWQVAGQATLGATSHFEGIILSKTAITLQTGASMKGRALAQTQIALDNNAITQPAQ